MPNLGFYRLNIYENGKLVNVIVLMILLVLFMIEPQISFLFSFLEVCKEKNLTVAAKQRHLSQSALSQQIAKLEEQLKVSLFYRIKSGLRLTEEGKKLLEYAVQLKNIYESMQQTFFSPDHLEVKDIILGIPEDLVMFYFPKLLEGFTGQFPDIRLHIHCDLTANLQKKFAEGELDVMIFKDLPRSRSKNEKVLSRENLSWVGKKGIKPRKPHETLSLVLAPHPCVYRNIALSALTKATIAFSFGFVSTSLSANLTAIEANLGVGALPTNMVTRALEVISDPYLPRLPEVEIVLCHRSFMTKNCRRFVAFVEDHFLETALTYDSSTGR